MRGLFQALGGRGLEQAKVKNDGFHTFSILMPHEAASYGFWLRNFTCQ